MRQTEAMAVINRMTYKPDVDIRCDYAEVGDTAIVIWIKATLPDAYVEGDTTQVIFQRILTSTELEWMDGEELIAYVRSMLLEFERHEMDEWFKVAGCRVSEPHERKQ